MCAVPRPRSAIHRVWRLRLTSDPCPTQTPSSMRPLSPHGRHATSSRRWRPTRRRCALARISAKRRPEWRSSRRRLMCPASTRPRGHHLRPHAPRFPSMWPPRPRLDHPGYGHRPRWLADRPLRRAHPHLSPRHSPPGLPLRLCAHTLQKPQGIRTRPCLPWTRRSREYIPALSPETDRV